MRMDPDFRRLTRGSLKCGFLVAAIGPFFCGTRRLQFRLRTLLLFVLLVAIGFSWIGTKIQRAARRWQTAGELQEAGFQIAYASEFPVINGIDDIGELFNQPGPSWLRNTLGFEPFEDIVFAGVDSSSGITISDDDLVILGKIDSVEMIDLSDSEVTNEGLRHLRKLPNLSYLELSNTKISDAGLEHLAGLSSLELLFLSGTRISDAGLKCLSEMPKLFSLWLDDTDISDAGLEHFKGESRIRAISARNTDVTRRSVSELKEASPNMVVRYGPE